MYISTGEMYISIWLDISGGRHVENEMYISSGKMYILTGEMYYSYLEAAMEIYISFSKWRPPDRNKARKKKTLVLVN